MLWQSKAKRTEQKTISIEEPDSLDDGLLHPFEIIQTNLQTFSMPDEPTGQKSIQGVTSAIQLAVSVVADSRRLLSIGFILSKAILKKYN